MTRIGSRIGPALGAAVLAAVVILSAWTAGPVRAEPAALSPAEWDGFLQWVHSLAVVVSAREEAERIEANTLYPFEIPAWDLDDPRPFRHLSISKAVTRLEARRGPRDGRPRGAHAGSAFMALANARNYVNLSEYDSALVWYRTAAEADTAGSFAREIAREGLASGIAAKDSLAVAARLAATLGADDLTGRQEELVLAYRWLLATRDAATLRRLVARVEAQREVLRPRLQYWHAYALGWLGHPDRCLAELRRLVVTGGLSHGLTEDQRAWVPVAIADTYFLRGDHETARELYASLATSPLPRLQLWGRYQLAGLDFVAHRYSGAADGFEAVCAGERQGTWQDHACAMVDIARELERIQGEGEPYGIAQHSSP